MQLFIILAFSIKVYITLVFFLKSKSNKQVLLNMGRRTTIEQRKLVVHPCKSGKTHRRIGEILNLSSSSVQHIIERYSKENRIENKGRIAPNKILSTCDERWIIRKIKENPRLSAQKIADEVTTGIGKMCSASTIRRVLRSHDFYGGVPLKKPFISPKIKFPD